MKLCSAALRYLNAHSTLNFARTFSNIKGARFEFYETQHGMLGIETIFLEGFKGFCAVFMKDKSSHIKNRKI